MSITGRTRVFAILADPIHHVRTPQTLNPILAGRGLDGVLVPIHVAAESLAEMVAAIRCWRNFAGFIATTPHKPAMRSLCDEVTPQAEAVGAVNAVRREPDGRLVGAMLDGDGFVAGLRAHGVEPRGLRVTLLGAGGAAAAIAVALAEAGAASLALVNRTEAKSRALRDRVGRLRPELPVMLGLDAEADMVVNATSLGLRPDDPPPLAPESLRAGQIVAEAIMEPRMTPLLRAAETKGCRLHFGQPMLDAQAPLMVDHMTGAA